MRPAPEPPPAPSLRRVALAAGATAAAVGVAAGPPGPWNAHAWGLPLLVACVGWIWWRLPRDRQMAGAVDAAVAALLLVPALAARQTDDAVASFDLLHTARHAALDGLLLFAARAGRYTAPMLAAAATGFLVLGGRAAAPGAGLLLGAAAGAAGATSATWAAREALDAGDAARAAALARLVPWAGLLALPGGALGALLHGRAAAWSRVRVLLLVLTALAAVRAASLPLGRLAATFPVPATTVAVPRGAAGPTTLGPAIDPAAGALDVALAAEGRPPATGDGNACTTGRHRWSQVLRATANIALPAEAPAAAIDDAAAALRARSTHRLALVGAATPSPAGPLGPLVAWPTVPLFLDPVPAGASVVEVTAAGPVGRPTAPAPGAPCAVSLAPDATVDDVWRAGRDLLAPAGPCDGLALLTPEAQVAVRADPADLDTWSCVPRRPPRR